MNQTNCNCKLRFFYSDVLTDLKTKMNCFALFNNRIVEGKIYSSEDFFIIDIGFKYLTIAKWPLMINTISLKVLKLETILNDLYFDHVKFKTDLAFRLNWSLIKKAFINRCFIRGRMLNSMYNGFSVGIWGFVGFLPKKYAIINRCNIRSVFVIMSIDYLKNTFVLSQSKIDKISPRTLFRLSSHLTYISKN